MNESMLLLILAASVSSLALLLLQRRNAGRPAPVPPELLSLKDGIERTERTIREEMERNRNEAAVRMRESGETLMNRLADSTRIQQGQFDSFAAQISSLTGANEQRLNAMRETIEQRLTAVQADNNKRLEEMRQLVDEKLHATLEQRLGESFRLVSERLEMVQRGLGEMQSLAAGVGDLKKVLTNVKTRGTWGEVQLGNLLDQILTREQYAVNVATKPGSADRVEFAVKFPGRDPGSDGALWLPIDAKFPQEDYQKLQEAQELAAPDLVEQAMRGLEQRIKQEGKTIRDKYIDPPHTTDFAIMFLPTEGLYAEVLRRPGLSEHLQTECRVIVTGPTTLAALLNSLQMGFRTLAIEKRSAEVWQLLGAVKTEFTRFGDALEKTQKKLQEASSSIDAAAVRTRAIERKLRNVQELPVSSPEEANGGAYPLLDE